MDTYMSKQSKDKSLASSRRKFIQNGSWLVLSALFSPAVLRAQSPVKLLDKWTQGNKLEKIGKHPELSILNDRPWNVETPPHLLDEAITPAKNLFVRNNGIPPQDVNVDHWTLTVEGEAVQNPRTFNLRQLKSKFEHYTYQLTVECGGNGRHEFYPPAKGNQWTTGAIGCPQWTGVRLKDVLQAVGLKDDAVYIGYYGADMHLSRDPDKVVISRGVPIEKALEDESLIVWALNGEDIPLMNGHPLRLVIGGWPGSVSGKWLRRIVVRDKVHDGPKMGGYSYRVPCDPVKPGTDVPEENMCIIQSMPVKSLITFPQTGAVVKPNQNFQVRGHTWAGDLEVSAMDISTDFGASWRSCQLKKPVNRLAWQQWQTGVKFSGPGYYEIWARAKDSNGKRQPMVVPGWNPKGYLNNACHRIAIRVKA